MNKTTLIKEINEDDMLEILAYLEQLAKFKSVIGHTDEHDKIWELFQKLCNKAWKNKERSDE